MLKRLSLWGALTAVTVLTVCGSALAADAVPLSPTPLKFPAAFTVAPGGKPILYGERSTGQIRWLDPRTGTKRAFFKIPRLATGGEQGLLGLALGPNYPADGRVWAYASRHVSGQTKNQILRIRADGSGLTVLQSYDATSNHNGGRIKFGPDGKLYVVIGENGTPARAQNLSLLSGKVLRVNPDGAVPADNPQAGSPIIAYGIRNSFGFTFDPRTGRLWETENGPECNDEINLIPRLRLENFGWGPSATCSTPPGTPFNTNQDGPSPVMPKAFFSPVPALTGAAFCDRCGLASPGRLFFGDYLTGKIRRAKLNADRNGIESRMPFYDHGGSVLSLETPANGGPIFFSTPANILRLKR